MSLTFHVRTDELWPAGWYPATIQSVERVPNKFADDESLKFVVLLRREDGEAREHWDWCSLPTSTKSKGYAWYRGVMGTDPPKGTCPMGDLLGMDCEARLEVKVKEDGTERNTIVAFRRPTKAGATTATAGATASAATGAARTTRTTGTTGTTGTAATTSTTAGIALLYPLLYILE